jgi:hypothetical protein
MLIVELIIIVLQALPINAKLLMSSVCIIWRIAFMEIIKNDERFVRRLLISRSKFTSDYLFNNSNIDFTLIEVLNYAPLKDFGKYLSEEHKNEMLDLNDHDIQKLEYLFETRSIQRQLCKVFKDNKIFTEKYWRSHGFVGKLDLSDIDEIEKCLYARSKNIKCNPLIVKGQIMQFIIDNKPELYTKLNLKVMSRYDVRIISRFIYLKGTAKIIMSFFNHSKRNWKYHNEDYAELFDISRRHDCGMIYEKLQHHINSLFLEYLLFPHVYHQIESINCSNPLTLTKFFTLKYFEGVDDILSNPDKPNNFFKHTYKSINDLEGLYDYFKRYYSRKRVITPEEVKYPLLCFSNNSPLYFKFMSFLSQKEKNDTLRFIIEEEKFGKRKNDIMFDLVLNQNCSIMLNEHQKRMVIDYVYGLTQTDYATFMDRLILKN